MELKGALSNPLVVLEVLPKLSILYHKLLSRIGSTPPAPAVVKVRAGEVTQTIYLVLSEHGSSMRAKEIQLAVEQRLGRPVGWSNVKEHLSHHSKGPKSRYLKVGYGRYLVRPMTAKQH